MSQNREDRNGPTEGRRNWGQMYYFTRRPPASGINRELESQLWKFKICAWSQTLFRAQFIAWKGSKWKVCPAHLKWRHKQQKVTVHHSHPSQPANLFVHLGILKTISTVYRGRVIGAVAPADCPPQNAPSLVTHISKIYHWLIRLFSLYELWSLLYNPF